MVDKPMTAVELVTEDQKLDYDINQAREDFIKDVLASGRSISYPKSNELQIDVDCEEHYAAFRRAIECVERNEVFDFEIEEHPSTSGLPNRHITVMLPFDVEPWQRIALQAAMGSDPMRELLSAIRLLKNDAHPTLFVEPGNA